MNIDRLDLIAFGHLTDVSIDLSAGPHRFHMIVGKNESGKSTSMRAIDAWLYGFPGQTKDAYLHPMNKLRVGGVLRSGDETLHCVRKKGRVRTLLDGSDGKSPISDALLESILGGVDQSTFGTQFLISHEELMAGGKMILQGEGELGEMLFAAGAGLGRLKKIQDSLRADEEALLKRQGRSKIGDAIRATKETRDSLKLAQVPPMEYANLQAQISEKKTRLAELKETNQSLAVEQARLLAKVEALPIVPQWHSVQQQLDQVADVPALADDFSERRRELSASMAVCQSNLKRITAAIERLKEEQAKLTPDESVLTHRGELDALLKELPVREKSELERTGYLTQVLADKDRDLRQRLADLAQETDMEVADQPEQQGSQADLSARVHRFQLNETQRNRVGRLASDYAQIIAQVDDARRSVDRLRQRIGEATDQLDTLAVVKNGDQCKRVLDQIDDPAVLAKRLSDAQTQHQLRQSKCETLAKRLGIPVPSETTSLVPHPDPHVIDSLTNRLREDNEELSLLVRSGQQSQSQLAEMEAEYEAIETDDHLPSAAALQSARQNRDQELRKLSKRSAVTASETSAYDEEVFDIESLVQWVRRADEIVDQLRMHQNEVADRERKVIELKRLSAKVASNQSATAKQRDQLQQTTEEWNSLWETIGVTAKSPAAMKDWSSDYEDLRELVDGLIETKADWDRAESDIRLAIEQLDHACEPERNHQADDASTQRLMMQRLMMLHDRATTLLDQHQHQQQQRDTLQRRIAEMKGDLQEAESILASRNDAMAVWQQQWNAATESLSAVSPSPDDVVPMLDAIKDLNTLQNERDNLIHRMKSIEMETEAFLKSAIRLFSKVAEADATKMDPLGLDDASDSSVKLQSVTPRLEDLGRRVELAQETAATIARLEQQSETLHAELNAESETAERHRVLSVDLCREAGCEAIDQLPEVESQSRARQQLLRELRQTEVDLKRLSGGDSIESLIESIGDAEPAILENQLDELRRQQSSVTAEIETETLALGELNHRMREINGGTDASMLSQTLASQLGEIGHDAETYIRLRLASGILRRAIEHYRGENQEPVMRIAESFFRDLTCGDYVGLRVDYDEKDQPILHGVRSDKDDVPAPGMSAGTADSLYLALRLASLQHRCEQGKPMPLIVDDCLQQLDDDRATAAMEVLSRLSKTTQVILFTHHSHLAGLAKQHLPTGGVHLHQLAS